MAKTSIIEVHRRIAEITDQFISEDGYVLIDDVKHEHNKQYKLPIGDSLILIVWQGDDSLEICRDEFGTWIAHRDA